MTTEDRWRSEEHARDWLARQDRPEADRSEQFRLMAHLLPFPSEAPLRIADLGAGHGTLTAVLLAAFPNAEAVCLDLNPTMIAAGQERLAPYPGRFRYVVADLAEAGWPADASGPFDVIASSRAIHHFTDPRKRELFGEIFAHLREGGWFLNFDHILAPSEALREIYVRAQAPTEQGAVAGAPRAAAGPAPSDHHSHQGHDHSGQDHHQGHHGHTSPLLGQLEMLEAVGFVDVDCFWKNLGGAIFGARKP